MPPPTSPTGAARPVERGREREPVHTAAGRHRAVERAGAVRVPRIQSKNGWPFAAANPSRAVVESSDTARVTSAPPANSTHARQPPGWSAREELRHACRRHPARAVKRTQPRVAA